MDRKCVRCGKSNRDGRRYNMAIDSNVCYSCVRVKLGQMNLKRRRAAKKVLAQKRYGWYT